MFPGVSRSGCTLTASLLAGWSRADAARFSFLLGIPSISMAGLVELKEAFTLNSSYGPIPLLIGILTAMIMSWVSIDWLLRFLQRGSTWIFVGYRFIFGLILLCWWRLYGIS